MACRSSRRYSPTNQSEQGSEIPVGLVKGSMKVPDAIVPCIFVGPGTGIAPMRAMIEQRIHHHATGIALNPFLI